MDHIKNYPEDYSKPLLVLLEMLGRANVNFFDGDKSWLMRNWRVFYIIPFMIFHFIAMSVPIMRELIAERDMHEYLTFPVYIITIQAFLKITIIIFNKRRLETIIEELGNVWRTNDLNEKQLAVKKAEAKELRVAVIAYMRFPFIVTLQYLLLPLLETIIFNVIVGEHDEKRFPFVAEYPFDPNSSWLIYGATYVYQCYCIFITVYIFIGSDFVFIALSAHLSREFLILREDLTDIQRTNLASRAARHEASILKFVRNHQKLITLAQGLDAAINKLMFINLLFTTLNVSFFGLSILATPRLAVKITYAVILITALMEVLIQCYFGEKLKTASEEIFQAACESRWYEGDIDYQKIICFIMLRSQKPCYLTSMKYTKITLQTFTKVLSTTWSYFSLVNTMYQRKK